jgi:hypothetical protein
MNVLINNNKHYIYLVLSILGGGFTFYYAILGVMAHNGTFNSIELIQSTWIDNYYAKSITIDFWTGAVAGTLFIVSEGLRLNIKCLWLYILLTFLVAFAFSFPLFLYMRARKLKQQ